MIRKFHERVYNVA